MKIEFSRLKKAMDYIEKHGDKGHLELNLVNFGTVKDHIEIKFNLAMDGDIVVIELPTDERAFNKIIKSERF